MDSNFEWSTLGKYEHIKHENYDLCQRNDKLEKKYAPALDNYGQSCFVRSDFLKMKCVCKTQMMPPSDHKKLYTSQKLFNTMYDVLSYSTCIQILPLIFHS